MRHGSGKKKLAKGIAMAMAGHHWLFELWPQHTKANHHGCAKCDSK
jgi:hypothetical protein